MITYTFFKHRAGGPAPEFQLEGFNDQASAEAHARALMMRSGYTAVDIFDGCDAVRLTAESSRVINLDYTTR
ncbi:MAG: hypothetical protein ACYDD1_15950 [Caulobacteraceae bacterium]